MRYLASALGAALVLGLVVVWACDDPPPIFITSPSEEDVVGGTVTLEATPNEGGSGADVRINYSDNAYAILGTPTPEEAGSVPPGKIARVKFLSRGKPIGSVSAPPYRVAWDTTHVHDGHCGIKAIAYDESGEVLGRSRTVNVTVFNLVSIDQPTKRDVLTGVATIAGCVKEDVEVSAVKLYVRGKSVASATSSPFSFQWDTTTVGDGEYILRVKAYDGKRRLGHSAVRVVVENKQSG